MGPGPVAPEETANVADMRDRRVTQILRDFMDAYVLFHRIGADLDWDSLQALVGDSEEAALYRLKEECHALFRFDKEGSETELQAEELFDLAVGALFHEAMRLREGFYLTTSYGPRLDRMLKDGTARGPLADAFRRVFAAGRERVRESQAQAAELFDETRDQLMILLREMPSSAGVARSLVEDPERAGRVFGTPLPELLDSVFGSAHTGYRLAVENLIQNGHFDEARDVLERDRASLPPRFAKAAARFTAGMARYYVGEPETAVDELERWAFEGAGGPGDWKTTAARALTALIESDPDPEPSLVAAAKRTLEALRWPSVPPSGGP